MAVSSVAKIVTQTWTSVMIICRPIHTLSLSFSFSPSFSLTHSGSSLSVSDSLCLFFPDISSLKSNFLISLDYHCFF